MRMKDKVPGYVFVSRDYSNYPVSITKISGMIKISAGIKISGMIKSSADIEIPGMIKFPGIYLTKEEKLFYNALV